MVVTLARPAECICILSLITLYIAADGSLLVETLSWLQLVGGPNPGSVSFSRSPPAFAVGFFVGDTPLVPLQTLPTGDEEVISFSFVRSCLRNLARRFWNQT